VEINDRIYNSFESYLLIYAFLYSRGIQTPTGTNAVYHFGFPPFITNTGRLWTREQIFVRQAE